MAEGYSGKKCVVDNCYRQTIDGETKCNGHIGHERKMETHPSFGVAVFSRYQGGGKLFGSSIKTNGGISLTIHQAQVRYDLGREWIHGSEQILEINMTETQFAQLLTSLNMGDGVPCTIGYVRDVGVVKPPKDGFNDEPARLREEFKEQAKEMTEELNGTIRGVKTILSKPSLGKKDREDIIKLMENFRSQAVAGMPFLLKSLQESMEKVVVQAKNEVVAFTKNALEKAGLPTSAMKPPKLISTEQDDG